MHACISMDPIESSLIKIQRAKAELSSKLSSLIYKAISDEYNKKASNQMNAFVRAAEAYTACCSKALGELDELDKERIELEKWVLLNGVMDTTAIVKMDRKRIFFTDIITRKFRSIEKNMAQVLLAYKTFAENPNHGCLKSLEVALAPTVNAYLDTKCK